MKKLQYKNAQRGREGGFTLLYASLVISLLLAIGLAIASISLKQFLLASSGKESQVAFYNADTGVECGLYYDHGKVGNFAFPTTAAERDAAIALGQTIQCAGITSSGAENGTTSPSAVVTRYKINASTCDLSKVTQSFIVEVEKKVFGDETLKTYIRARGYNTCDTTNPRRVERGLKVEY